MVDRTIYFLARISVVCKGPKAKLVLGARKVGDLLSLFDPFLEVGHLPKKTKLYVCASFYATLNDTTS